MPVKSDGTQIASGWVTRLQVLFLIGLINLAKKAQVLPSIPWYQEESRCWQVTLPINQGNRADQMVGSSSNQGSGAYPHAGLVFNQEFPQASQ